MTPDKFYIFIDTNLLYDDKLNYQLFNSWTMKELLEIRNNYNKVFGDYKEILLHFPEIVLKEVFFIKCEISKQKLQEVTKHIQYLEEDKLKVDFEVIGKKFIERLRENGNLFISNNEIIVVPCCSDCYFKEIVQKSIEKKIPFKPKFDEKKKRYTGDNGFKDTVIWYSIIEYIKKQETNDNDQIILLTNNISDFKTESTLREFKSLTNKEIHIINFKPAKSNGSNPSEFLSIILENLKDLKIDTINISYLKIKDKIQIHSIKGSPLHFNLASLFPNSMDPEKFEDKIEKQIKSRFSSFGFNVQDLNFNFVEAKVVAVTVNLRNYKLWFIDIDCIELEFEDGIRIEEYNFDDNFSTDILEYNDYDGESRESDEDFGATIISILKSRGYHHIEPSSIEYEIEYIPPDD